MYILYFLLFIEQKLTGISSRQRLYQYYCIDSPHGRCREKARWELQENFMNYIEQILEVTPHEATALRPLTSYL